MRFHDEFSMLCVKFFSNHSSIFEFAVLCFLKPIEKVLMGLSEWRLMRATIALESMPPRKKSAMAHLKSYVILQPHQAWLRSLFPLGI
jgi:hypothetical protein